MSYFKKETKPANPCEPYEQKILELTDLLVRQRAVIGAAVRVIETWAVIGTGRARVSSPEFQEEMILLEKSLERL